VADVTSVRVVRESFVSIRESDAFCRVSCGSSYVIFDYANPLVYAECCLCSVNTDDGVGFFEALVEVNAYVHDARTNFFFFVWVIVKKRS